MDPTTLNLPDHHDTQNSPIKAPELEPSIQILYHGDLARIGEVTAEGTFEGGIWVALGRLEPIFESPQRSGRRPLADPYISRAQAAVRFNTATGNFDIKPSNAARLKLAHVELRLGQQAPYKQPLTEVTSLPPGSLLDIGGRILLLLQYQVRHTHQEDRMGMVGETPQMWDLRQLIADVAGFDRSALILGQTGSGKELVCRALHDQSPRKSGPLMATNSAALPEHLIESLLFGHKKGAFTGAQSDSSGLFVEANGGTLFLDELGEMPMRPQAKLLRVLEDSMVTPVGAKRAVQVDVRVVAATNRAPQAAIEQGLLRSDLYYRLASHVIRVPTLAERRWDVPVLFAYFLGQNLEARPSLSWLWSAPTEARLPMPVDFILELLRHPWTGNIRELKNVADQTALLNLRPGPFTIPELRAPTPPSSPTPISTPTPSAAPQPAAPPVSTANHDDILRAAQKLGLKRKTARQLLSQSPNFDSQHPSHSAEFTQDVREHLADALYEALVKGDFNQTHVAQMLGVSRSTLINQMKLFGIPRASDLTDEQLLEAHAACSGDLEAMARMLRVSSASLKLRLVKSTPNFQAT